MERFAFIFLAAGLAFFALAFGISAVLPALGVTELKVRTVEELTANPPQSFKDLKAEYPAAFRRAFYKKTDEQALTELQSKGPSMFTKVFTLTDEERLARLHADYAPVFKKVFGEQSVKDAQGEMDFSHDEIIAKIKSESAAAYAQLFEVSLTSAVASLRADYALRLLQIKSQTPDIYAEIFDERPDAAVMAEALRRGREIYAGEGCWHCHSQQIRPWGNDEARYGQMSYPEEYHNEMNLPPLWGTRRIGPDLIRRGGKLSNDWHVAHFFNPRDTSPVSVMPRYPWFFEADGITLTRDGLSIITYVQWLGSWQESAEETVFDAPAIKQRNKSGDTAIKETTP